MRKLRLLFNSEPKVDLILRRSLAEPEYRVCPKVRLGDAIGKDDGEHLPERAFRYLLMAHLDFLVTKDGVPFFAVEFDGAAHFTDRATIERDILKNRLCYAAELPILRITTNEIVERDKLTLLDYMLSRIIAWPKELPEIRAEIAALSSTIPVDYDEEYLAADLDPSFHFNLRHPYPLIAELRKVLWDSCRISDESDPERLPRSPAFLYEVAHLGSPHPRHTELRRSAATLKLWSNGIGSPELLFDASETVTMRWALSLGHEPPPGMAPDAIEAINNFSAELSSMGVPVHLHFPWSPNLPGIDPHDIGDNYAEYLVTRKLKTWALEHLQRHI